MAEKSTLDLSPAWNQWLAFDDGDEMITKAKLLVEQWMAELRIPDDVEEISTLLGQWNVMFLRDDDANKTETITRAARVEEELFRFYTRLIFATELVYNLDASMMKSWKAKAMSAASSVAEWKAEAYFIAKTNGSYRHGLGVMGALLEAVKKRQQGIHAVVGSGKLMALRGQDGDDE